MSTFGEEHRKLRLEKTTITLRDYAKKLNVSPTYVSNVEKGVESPFSAEILRRSARVMRLSPKEEARLFSLRNKSAKQSKIDNLVFQVARRTRYLSEAEFEDIVRRVKRQISEERKTEE
jgi:transcriptional regulator with XRE-family HTH domain